MGLKGNPFAAFAAVFAAFIGVRRRGAHDSDEPALTPVQVVISGIVAAALFVVGLILMVRFLISIA